MTALGNVAASVAHEIRNPLCGIEGFACLLARDCEESSSARNSALKIIYATRQLNAVVSNLLNYSREMRGQFGRYELKPLIDDIVEIIQPMATDRHVTITRTYDDGDLTVEIDPVQIKQIITNLLVNALEACPRKAGGRIELKAARTKKRVRLTVSDNGSGISKKVLRQIFEPFYTTKDGGIGLGLALCQRIIEPHEGTIHCSSEEGRGTVFTIELNDHLRRRGQND